MDELAQWVRESFGLGDGPARLVPAGRGAVGEVLRLTVGGAEECPEGRVRTAASADYAVKRLPGDVDQKALAAEDALLDHLAAQGIEVPTHVRSLDGSLVLRVPENLGGGSARVTHWVEGEPVVGDTGAHAEALGTLLAQLHRAAPPADEPPSRWYTTMLAPSDWDVLRARSIGQPWHDALVARSHDLAQLHELVRDAGDGSAPFVVGRRDLHPDNALVAPDGTLRALDWEDAGPLYPTRELAKVVLQWHVLGETVDDSAVARTLAAYRSAGGPGRVTTLTDFAMAVCTESNFLAHMIRVALDERSESRGSHARTEIAESLAILPSVRTLERVRAALSG